jgi:hypothetical protein
MKFYICSLLACCLSVFTLYGQEAGALQATFRTAPAEENALQEPVPMQTLQAPHATNNPAMKPPPQGSSWNPVGGIGENMIVGQNVRDIAVAPNGDVYALGAFKKPFNNLVKWNGTSWESLSFEPTGPVYAIEVTPDGTLYAGGYFCMPNYTACYLAKWDGFNWTSVPNFAALSVSAMTLDQNGDLLVAGELGFPGTGYIRTVGRWDGTTLTPLGSTTQAFNGTIWGLATDSLNQVYIGGEFTKYGTINMLHVSKFDGTNWSSLAQGISGQVNSITTHGTDVVVGGNFTVGSSLVLKDVAKWNGTAWSAIGDGLTGGIVRTVKYDASGALWAGGTFHKSGTTAMPFIGRWDGTAWQPVPVGADTTVIVMKNMPNGHLLVGGNFVQLGPLAAPHITEWDGTNWKAFGHGLTNCCYFQPIAIDTSNNIYIAGHFKDTDNPALLDQDIVKWNGTAWSKLGLGLEGNVRSIEITPSGRLYAAGSITKAGSLAVNNITQWDGSNWLALGPGMDGPLMALALDSGTSLYAGGYFAHIGTALAHNVARWDGTAWTPLPTGTNKPIQAMAYQAGNLYVAGKFTLPNAYLSKWDGTAWSAVGTNALPNNLVRCLKADHAGNVYAGGSFTKMGADSMVHIARFNGTTWESLGAGLPGPVLSIDVDAQNNVYATYTVYADAAESRVGKWDGSTWTVLAPDVKIDHHVSEIRLNKDGKLYAAGTFITPYPTLITYGECQEQLTVSMSAGAPLLGCNADTVTLTPQICGGSGQFSYHWNTGATTPYFKDLPETNKDYCVTITDEAGPGYQVACATIVRNKYYCTNQVSKVVVDTATAHSLTVSWFSPDSANVGQYLLTLYLGNYALTLQNLKVPGSSNSYTFNDLICDTNFVLVVNPMCGCKGEDFQSYNSYTLKARTTSCPVGTDDLPGEDITLTISPQPVAGNFTLDTGKPLGPGQLTIFQSNGSAIATQSWAGASRQIISTESLRPGLYWVSLQTAHIQRSVRFVKL